MNGWILLILIGLGIVIFRFASEMCVEMENKTYSSETDKVRYHVYVVIGTSGLALSVACLMEVYTRIDKMMRHKRCDV